MVLLPCLGIFLNYRGIDDISYCSILVFLIFLIAIHRYLPKNFLWKFSLLKWYYEDRKKASLL